MNPEDYVELITNSKMGVLTLDRLSAVHAVGLAHALSMSSNREAPIMTTSFIFALGPVLVKGWNEMPIVKQAAAAAALSSSANAIQKIRDFAELAETKGNVSAALSSSGGGGAVAGAAPGAGPRSGAAYRRKLYILLMHDEGADKKKSNKLLVYGVWRNADGTLSRPVLLGCLDCSKTGAENARVIKERLEELGLGSKEIVVLGQTVDGAGTKTVHGLEELGLLFTIICECHCVNKIAQQYETWVGAPTCKARNHPVTLLFNVTYLIRRLVKITAFFEITALGMQELFVGRGGDVRVAEQLIVGSEIQSAAHLVDACERVRWASVERGAANLMAGGPLLDSEGEPLLDRNDPRLEPYLKAGEVTLRGVIVIGLHKLFSLKRAYWYTKPSKQRLKYGSVPLVVKTAAELEDPRMLCHLALLADVYPLIAQMLALARGAESRGGGGADLLKIRRWGLERLLKLTVASLPTLPLHLAVLRQQTNGAELVESFERGARLVFSRMVEKRKEHLRRSQTTNFMLSLADPYMAEASVELLVNLMIEEGVLLKEVNEEHDPLEPVHVFAPFDIPLVTPPQELAAECMAAIAEGGGFSKMDWAPTVMEHASGLLKWRSAGCPVSPSYEGPTVDLLVNGLQVARRGSMEVELGVGDLSKADRAVARSFLTAVGQQGRLILFSAARRMRRAGRNAAPPPKAARKRAKRGADDSEMSYEDPSESKVVHMFVLLETAKFIESIGSSVLDSAKNAASQRRYLAERSRTEARIIKVGIEKDIERAAAEGKADTFEAQVSAARADMMLTNVTPRTYHLWSVEQHTREYIRKDMARTLAVHLRRSNAEIDVVEETLRLLAKHTKEQLRTLLTEALFNVAPGESWVTKFLPMPGLPLADQILGVQKAKEMSTPQMVAAGTAWAWKV